MPGVTRGALYHHFADKTELFAAVLEKVEGEMAVRMAETIAAAGETDPVEIMRLGSAFWLDACADPEVQRILLMDAPAVLGAGSLERDRAALQPRTGEGSDRRRHRVRKYPTATGRGDSIDDAGSTARGHSLHRPRGQSAASARRRRRGDRPTGRFPAPLTT